MNVTDLFETQIALEQESLAAGQERYFRELKQHQESGTEDRTRPVMALIRRSIGDVSAYIAAALEHAARARAGRRQAAVMLIREMRPEVLAFLTLRECFASVSSKQAFTGLAAAIGTAVAEEINFSRFKEQDEDTYKITQTHIRTSTTGDRKRSIVSHMFRISEIDPVQWTPVQKVSVGTWLIDALVQSTGLFEVRNASTGVRREERRLCATDELMRFIADAHDKLSMFCPVRLPMVIAPRPWVSPNDGGYLTDCGGRVNLVKTRNAGYLESLHDVDMPDVYSAINAIQTTAWQINSAVLSVARAIWATGEEVGGLPNRNPEDAPAPPAGFVPSDLPRLRKENPQLYKQWASKAAAVHESNARLYAKRMAAQEKLNVASRFAEFDRIYFPHTIDFRGRAYPLPMHLNPQSDDLGKSLLRFADGKPIGERGLWWLKVHIANCFGIDKVSFEERVAWADSKLDLLMDSGLDPVDGRRFWAAAEDPFQALAACFELVGCMIQGPDYVSHLPIPMDGSCNGLQNFSALLRDDVGGKATNLVPADKPADIYSEVARVVAERVRADALGGNPIATLWDGKISRKIVKQPVMTLPYGATKTGMRKQIEDALHKNYPGLFPKSEVWNACIYLANLVYDCIGLVVIAARSAMDWLRETAKIASSESYPIRWTAPSGLPVLQEYRKLNAKCLRLHVEGQQVELYVNIDGDKLDRRRQTAGISPNLIHSFDAAHMMATVNLGSANGLSSFSMIHDSYAVHACDTDVLHACIREAFIEQYNGDLLARFRDELVEQLPPDAVAKMPPLPCHGSLDLSVIRGSRYFFA